MKIFKIADKFALLLKDLVPGGLADRKDLSDFDEAALQEGIRVEMEHTNNPELALEIATDHLTEDPDYYKKLRSIEGEEADLSPLSDLLACLRAASHIHQTHHWQTSGPEYYADHLLFERLYDEGQEFIDQVAERAVGGDSIERVDAVEQVDKVGEKVHKAYSEASGGSPQDMVRRSLAIENMVIENIKTAINTLSSTDSLSAGTSNLLEGIADTHETFLYLLKQRNTD